MFIVDSNNVNNVASGSINAAAAPGGIVLPLEQHYLPPAAANDIVRSTRHTNNGQPTIYVTPVPQAESRWRSNINQARSIGHRQQERTTKRQAFRPSARITSLMSTQEFVPKTQSQPVRRVFFPSVRPTNDRNHGTYVDESRNAFVSSSSSVNPFSQYTLSWKPRVGSHR